MMHKALVFAPLFVGACMPVQGVQSNTRPAAPAPATASAEAALDSVTMRRGSCYRRCAEYVVTITFGGSVHFTGLRNVAALGSHAGTASAAAVTALLAEVRSARLDTLPGKYADGTVACGNYAADLPTVTLTVVSGRMVRQIVQDYGCSAAPRVLRELHQRIDEVANTERWIGQP